jgi:hypothetical protein
VAALPPSSPLSLIPTGDGFTAPVAPPTATLAICGMKQSAQATQFVQQTVLWTALLTHPSTVLRPAAILSDLTSLLEAKVPMLDLEHT